MKELRVEFLNLEIDGVNQDGRIVTFELRMADKDFPVEFCTF